MIQPDKPASTRSFLVPALLAALAFALAASAAIPRPEQPHPDACRTNWASLNGEWQFIDLALLCAP